MLCKPVRNAPGSASQSKPALQHSLQALPASQPAASAAPVSHSLPVISLISLVKMHAHGKFPDSGFGDCPSTCSDLSRNRLRRIEGLTFQGLLGLRSLRMQRNGITRLMDGAFFGLSNMEVL